MRDARVPQQARADMRRPRPPPLLDRLRARGPRVHCITNDVAQNFTANVLLAAGCVPSMTLSREEIAGFVARRRCAAGQSRHLRRRAPRGHRDRGRGGRARRRCPGCSIRSSSTAAPRAPVSRARCCASSRRRCGSTRPNLPRSPAARRRPPRSRARSRTVLAISGETDLIADGERSVSVANGHPLMAQGHRHGLRRLGAGGGLSGGRAGRLARHRRGAGHDRRCRRTGGGKGARARQLRGRDPRCAL